MDGTQAWVGCYIRLGDVQHSANVADYADLYVFPDMNTEWAETEDLRRGELIRKGIPLVSEMKRENYAKWLHGLKLWP